MFEKLPADKFIKAAAALSGRDPGDIDAREALHILQEYGREPQGELYRQLTDTAAEALFSDPGKVAEWQEALEALSDDDAENTDLLAFALQRDLSPVIRKAARQLLKETEENDDRRRELEKIIMPTPLILSEGMAEFLSNMTAGDVYRGNGLMQKAAQEVLSRDKAVSDAIAAAIKPAVDVSDAIAAALKPAADAAREISERLKGLTGKFAANAEVFEQLQAVLNEFAENNPAFSLYAEIKGDLAPYFDAEIQKAEYEGLTFRELWEEAQASEEGLFSENNRLMRAVNAARSAKEAGPADKETAERVTVARAKSVEYPLDKPNSIIWNLLEKDTEGQISFNMAKYGSKLQLPAYYAIDFDALGNDITITKRLLPFDKLAYIAISALFNAGNTVITLSQIYYAMGYTGRPGKKDLIRINNAVTKMTTARIFFDNEQEAAKYKYSHFKYDGSLLPLERGTAIVNGQLADAAIHIFREPPLITFAKQRNQITTLDIKLLQAPISKTDENLLIQDYLLERISKAKNGKGRNCRILLKTLYNHAGIPDKPKTNAEKQQKRRAPAKVQKYLTHYQQQGYIKRFDIENDGITIYW